MGNISLHTIQTLKLGVAFAVFAFASLGLFVSAASAAGTLLFGATAGPDHVILVSDLSDVPTANDFSAIKFDDETGNLVSSITSIGTDYNVTDDDCGGGAPRFQVAIDMDGNATSSPADKNVFIYIGPHPSFTGCTPNTWVSTGNLITSPDPRFDTSQIPGGTFYDTWANVLALVGNKNVLSISIAVDAGWMFGDMEQTVLIDNTDINGTFYDYNPAPPPPPGDGAINSSKIKIEVKGAGTIENRTSSKSSTGGNDAKGSRGGRGGSGGDVSANADADGGKAKASGNNGAALAGDGGNGGNGSLGGLVNSGRATSRSDSWNELNAADIEITVPNVINSSEIEVEVKNEDCNCNLINNNTRSRARTGGNDASGSSGGSGGGGGDVEADAEGDNDGDADTSGNNGAAVGGNGGTGGTGAAGGEVNSGIADSMASTTNRANISRIRITN